MKIPFPQFDLPGRLSGASDAWDTEAGAIFSDEYFALPKFETFVDNFDDNNLDAAQWFNWGGAEVVNANQQLEMTILSGAANYQGVESVKYYRLKESSVSIQITNAGNQALTSLEVTFSLFKDTATKVFFLIAGNNLIAYKRISNSNVYITQTGYNSTTQKYLRIRETAGVTYWEYSANGTAWTTLHSEATPFVMEQMKLELVSGVYATEATSTLVIYDNLNFVPASGGTVNSARPAELSGSAQSNSNRSAELSGSISVNDARSAELFGSAAANAQRPAEMHGQAPSNDVRSAELTGAITSTDQRPAEINASAPANSNRSAEIHGQDSSSSNRPSEMNGVAGAADARSSELSGVDSAFSVRSAELHGSQSVNSNRPAELTGADSATSQRSSEMHGSAVASSVRPAELSGKADSNSNRSAEISGADSAVSARAAEMEGEIVGATVNSSRAAEMHGSAVGVDSRPSEISGSDSAVTSRPAEIGGAASASDSRPGEMEGVNPPAVSSRSAEMNAAPRPQDIRGTFTATPKAGTTTLVRENQSIDLTRVGEGAPVTHKGGSYGLTRKGDII